MAHTQRCCGTLYADRSSLSRARSSSPSRSAPRRGHDRAPPRAGRRPPAGMPVTYASSTSGYAISAPSTSAGVTLAPPGGLDHLAQPAGEVEPAVVVEVAGVAGAVAAVGLEHVFALAPLQSLHQRVAAQPRSRPRRRRGTSSPRRRDRRSCARCPASDLPNVPRRDSGSGVVLVAERVRAAHLGHAERRRSSPRAGGARAARGRACSCARPTTRRGPRTTGAPPWSCPVAASPVAIVARSCSMSVERRAGLERALGHEGRAEVHGTRSSAVMRPPIQKNGIDENITSSGPIG